MWPWNKSKDGPDALTVIRHFIAEAEAALGSADKDAIRRARVQLDIALGTMRDVPDGTGAIAHANELLGKLEAITHPLNTTGLTACPCCGGGELLVAENASTDGFYVGNGGAPLKFTMIVCRACGDMRMRCTDLGALALLRNAMDVKCFLPVSVPEEHHPYRAR